MSRSFVILSGFLWLAACGGGGGSDGTGGAGPILPPPDPAASAAPETSGIVAAAAGSGSARIDLTLPGAGFEAALFVAGNPDAVFAGAPLVAPVTTAAVLPSGLVDDQDVFFGCAVRAVGASVWTPAGAVVRVRPSAPIYVDAAADPARADGLTPATAFPNLQDALLVAGSRNGGNVWVRDGEYAAGPYALGPNVHVAGGFAADFALATRAAAGLRTRLSGSTGLQLVEGICGGSDGSLDGLVVDGRGVVTEGIDVVDSDVELRGLLVRGCVDRGVRAKVTAPVPNRRLQLVACTLLGNGADGLSSAGPIDLRLDRCRFDGNGQEGVDVDDLAAPSGGRVTLWASGCRCFGNVFEGFDVDLAAVPLATAPGSFDVRIENCRFEQNGLDGLLIDQEHEFDAGFFAAITVRGVVARANRGAGVHLDADAAGTYRLELLRCTANLGDGVLVTSESHAGMVPLVASWLAGNLGYGARAGTGNVVLLVQHAGVQANRAGGLRGDGWPVSAMHCVFTAQPNPRSNADSLAGLDHADPAAVFTVAPVAHATVTAQANGSLTVAVPAPLPLAALAVAGDDGRALQIVGSTTTAVVVDPAPTAFTTPGDLAVYPGTTVVDDLRLAGTSPARAAGLAAPGAPATDLGPHAAAAGGEPGRVALAAASTLWLTASAPDLATGVANGAVLQLVFDRALDPATVTQDRVVVVRAGVPVPCGLTVAGSTLTLAPPPGGWGGAVQVRVLAGLAAMDGSPLAAPFQSTFRSQ